MLPQANTVKMTSRSTYVKHYSWWDYDFAAPDNEMTFEDAKEGTLNLFGQAVERQMVADVPVGSYLSGEWIQVLLPSSVQAYRSLIYLYLWF